MILEIRRYTLKPGRREKFIAFFESENRKALRDAGMLIFGPMRDLDDPDEVHWLRAFQTLEDRDRIKEAFYSSEVWNDRIEPRVRSLIERYEASLVETTQGFETFDRSNAL